MSTHLVLDDLLEEVPTTSEGGYYSIQTPGLSARGAWGLGLLMAVRENASWVFLHSWQGEERFGEVVEGVRYTWTPPPTAEVREMLSVARSMISRGDGRPRVWDRLLRRRAVASRIHLEVEGAPSEWFGVYWAVDDVGGVDFFRLSTPHRY
jgi:hypothetical protein